MPDRSASMALPSHASSTLSVELWIQAAAQGDIATLSKMIAQGADPEGAPPWAIPWERHTALITAMREGQAAAAALLLDDRPARILERSRDGASPALMAASSGSVECLRAALLRMDPFDPKDQAGADGWNPLALSLMLGRADCARELLRAVHFRNPDPEGFRSEARRLAEMPERDEMAFTPRLGCEELDSLLDAVEMELCSPVAAAAAAEKMRI